MRACPECNTPYQDDQVVCPIDGRRLLGAGADPTPERWPPTPPKPREVLMATPTPTPAPQFAQGDDDEDCIGATLGSYRVLAVIGRGGMGRVYLAEHILLERRVALKLLRSEYAAKRDAVARFFQEARAVSRIRHKNIVDVTDFVETPSGMTFIVMEFLEGATLGEMLRKQIKISIRDAVGYAIQVCEGLDAAHSEGIIHRDLKPDNIFVGAAPSEGQVKILDFGVAKLLGSTESEWQTIQGSVVGTPAYMSPEQAAGTTVDHRADLYSLGAILYETFAGKRVFEGKSFGEFVLKHMNEEPVPIHEVEGSIVIPRLLERTILRCLEKRPNDRFQTARELREVLVDALEVVDAEVEPERMPGHLRRRLWWFAFAGAGALALLLLVMGAARKAPTAERTPRPAPVADPAQPVLNPTPPVAVAPATQPTIEPIDIEPTSIKPPRLRKESPPRPEKERRHVRRQTQRRPKQTASPAKPSVQPPSKSDTINPFEGE